MRLGCSLIVEQFHSLFEAFGGDVCWRTMLLVAVSFGLRIAELLGLEWCDVDWARNNSLHRARRSEAEWMT
jgi:integrase